MESRPPRFKQPPVTCKKDGSLRSVGFELEFSGLKLEEAVAAVLSSLGGAVKSHSAAEQNLNVAPFGIFTVEVDWDYLKRKAAENGGSDDADEWIDVLSQAAALVVPIEVVCPPIPIVDLEKLHPMVGALRDAGAVGTEESLIAAYGVHINSEIPSLDATTLSSYLKAFALLQWWLVAAHEVDMTRKLSPYVNLYPEAYVKELLSGEEATLDEIFADYLEYNPSRNRALDLLPLLAEIDETRVRRSVDDPRIKPRPAFHYRLPNCHIERPDWSLARPWNIWWVVECLSQRPEDIEELSAAFLAADRPLLGVNRANWVEFMDRWLKDRALV